MLGEILQDRYRLDSELGRGGMGVIYHAHDMLLDRPVALKVLSDPALGTEGRARLLREAQAAAQLNHPNIVIIHDAGEATLESAGGKRIPFIVMELVEGGSLHERRPDSMERILEVAIQICTALEHAHDHNIVHRDLKPENVLIAEDGTVKLMDFGLARSIASRMTQEGGIVGTVYYLAPEQALGQPLDGRADLYALGVMLYELTTGSMPFTADDPLAIISQHLHAPVVPPNTYNAELPAVLDDIIVQLLSKQPEDRPVSAQHVRTQLESIDVKAVRDAPREERSVLERIARGRMVGREKPFLEAQALWRRALAGEGQVLLVSGEPGIGKTRFVRELSTLAEVSEGMVLSGECYAEGGASYAPIAQIIRKALGDIPATDLGLHPYVLADLVALTPDLQVRYPALAPNPELDPQMQQQRMFESVLALCANIAARTPLAITIEDAHWADSGTLSLLRHLARRSRTPGEQLRLMIVMTYREVELTQERPLNELLYDFNRERLAKRIKLTRLDKDQTGEMLTGMFAGELAPECLEAIYRETEGNPFFIEEVVKTLVEDGKLYRDNGRWLGVGISQLEIPQSVRVAIQARLSKLAKSIQDVMQLAATFGREFTFETLKAMGEFEEDVLIEALEIAERAQLIQEVRTAEMTQSTFAFAHALIPSTLQESVSGLRRRRLHLRAAQALEQIYADRLDEFAPRIGRHFSEAGEWEQASEYLLKAGDRAYDLFAYRDALEHYHKALTILRAQGEDIPAARTLMKIGVVSHILYDFEHSRQAYKEAFEIRRRAGEPRSRAKLPDAPHAFRTHWHDPNLLDPNLADDSGSIGIIKQLFKGLLEISPENEVIPEMAQDWDVQQGGREYVFHLRDDVIWTDGVPVTAGDFEYAWKRTLDPAQNSPAAGWLYDIRAARAYNRGEGATSDDVGVRALDDHTLLVELEDPCGHFFHILAISATYPVPRHVVEKFGVAWTETEHLVTNGPFKLESREPEKRIVLRRNENYRGQSSGNLQSVELLLGHQWKEHLDLYEAGELDLLTDLPPEVMDRVRVRYPEDYFIEDNPGVSFLSFDTKRPPFDELRVRTAFAHAIDRERMVGDIFRGYVSPAVGGLVPPGVPGHSPDIGLAFDPERARQLLAEAGYPQGEDFPDFEFMLTKGQEGYSKEGEFIVSQWAEHLGVEIKIHYLGYAEFRARLRASRPNVYATGWNMDYPDPDNVLQVALSSSYVRPEDPTFRNLIREARQSNNQSERMALYQKADRRLMESAVVVPLVYGQWHMLMKPWLSGLHFSVTMNSMELKDVIIREH